MKRQLYILLFTFSALFVSCQKPQGNDGGDGDKPSSSAVTFNFGITKLPETSYAKPSFEDKINDLSVYVVVRSKKSGTAAIVKTAYRVGADAMEPLTLDFERRDDMTYHLYAFANYGKDMTQVTKPLIFERFEKFEVTYESEADFETKGLPFAAVLDIPATDNKVNVVLKRKVAKIELNFSITPGYEDNLAVNSAVVTTANHLYTFKPSVEYDCNLELAKKPIINNQVSFYVLENIQGVVKECQSSTDRLTMYPDNSTDIRIYSSDNVMRRCFLGENNTSDFNVTGDKHYIYNLNLIGDDMSIEVSTVAGK